MADKPKDAKPEEEELFDLFQDELEKIELPGDTKEGVEERVKEELKKQKEEKDKKK